MSEELRKLKEQLKDDGTKSGFSKSPEILARAAQVKNRSTEYVLKEGVITQDIDGHLLIRTSKKHDKVLFAIPGGGFVFKAGQRHLDRAIEMGERSNRDVIYPVYPTVPEYSLKDTFKMIMTAYEMAVKEYGAKNIAVTGFSAGGSAVLTIAAILNRDNKSDTVPEKIVAISPGIGVENDSELENMKELDKKDLQIPISFLDTLSGFSKGEDPIYTNPLIGDLKGIKELYVYYGGDELFSAKIPAIEAVCKKNDIKLKITKGEGMFHCFPLFTEVPECAEVFEEITEILK